jgi:hypothetical protein
MPLQVRFFAQERRMGCLPAALRSVRAYYDDVLTDEEASELCAELPLSVYPDGGCTWADAIDCLSMQYEVHTLQMRQTR